MMVYAIDGKDYRLPNGLNPFQRELYVHLINWKWQHISTEPGTARGHKYDAILPDACAREGSSPLVYPGVAEALAEHRRKNKFRIHLHFYHMASSQAANINLFLPILHHPNASAILGAIKPDFDSLATAHLDNGYCIEFWGGNLADSNICSGNAGLLGDKSAMAGTDSDIAIAYHNHEDELCLWLIEHKLTEKEFTACGGFKSHGRQARHDCGKSFSDILRDKSSCYYHDVRKFNYWKLTEVNRTFFANHARRTECPFKGGMNQLWRNQLLALGIEQDTHQPYKHVTFSVVKHPKNTYLDATLDAYTHLIADSPKFSVLTSADVIAAAGTHADATLTEWVAWYKGLYAI
jgi:hypothetical protein